MLQRLFQSHLHLAFAAALGLFAVDGVRKAASVMLELSKHGAGAPVNSTNTSSTGSLLSDFPQILRGRLTPVRYLGAGSFGESWLVEGVRGTPYWRKQVVAKLLLAQGGNHVTHHSLSGNSWLERQVAKVAKECDFAERLQQEAPKMDESIGRNAQRLMACYSHNYQKEKDLSIPIYLILENCGQKDLRKFIKEKKAVMSQQLIASILRQILEGLQYLAKQPKPVIHHDLKPSNIVVKEIHDSPFPAVHLIDYGAMMEAESKDADHKSRGRTCTAAFAPPEWFQSYPFRMPPSSFDMYAVGNILAVMTIGPTFNEAFPKSAPQSNTNPSTLPTAVESNTNPSTLPTAVESDHMLPEPNFEMLQRIAGFSSRNFCIVFPGLLSMFKPHDDAYNFIGDYWLRMISGEPTDRPTPEEALKAPWMVGSLAPDDPDWVMYSSSASN